MALDEREPARLTPLETRFLVVGSGQKLYGVTYKWNEDLSDAEVVLERKTRDLNIVQADGSVRLQRYEFPGPTDCMACHSEAAGSVLGVRTEQVSRAPHGESQENQITQWSLSGFFTEAVDAAASQTYPQLAALGDESRSLEDRIRSYWASNCSMCHGSNPKIRAAWDARYATPLEEQGVILGKVVSRAANKDAHIITPGSPKDSIMLDRGTTAEVRLGAMPPLSRRRVDSEYVALLERWILSLAASDAGAGPSTTP
jgi:mono/diheme cytochrome c family protein